jgi:hypothetical protein
MERLRREQQRTYLPTRSPLGHLRHHSGQEDRLLNGRHSPKLRPATQSGSRPQPCGRRGCRERVSLLTPIDRWGHTPYAAKPLTGQSVATLIRAHLTGHAPTHHRPPRRPPEPAEAPTSARERLSTHRCPTGRIRWAPRFLTHRPMPNPRALSNPWGDAVCDLPPLLGLLWSFEVLVRGRQGSGLDF